MRRDTKHTCSAEFLILTEAISTARRGSLTAYEMVAAIHGEIGFGIPCNTTLSDLPVLPLGQGGFLEVELPDKCTDSAREIDLLVLFGIGLGFRVLGYLGMVLLNRNQMK